MGIGNILQSDDGIGIKILKYLESQYEFPENVELVDGGTAGAALDRSIVNKDWVIIIDALGVQGEPGEVRVLAGEDFINRPATLKMSPHQVSFLDLIQMMKLEGTEPKKLDLVGVIPETTHDGIEITSTVNAAIAGAVESLLRLLKENQIKPQKRDPPLKPDYWWL